VHSRKPDLIFGEYAANDVGTPAEQVSRAMEGIARQVRIDSPAADICRVYSLYQGMLDDYKGGPLPLSIKPHEQVAAHYGMSSVSVGLVVARRLLSAEMKWDEFSGGVCRPTDAGYQLFANTAIFSTRKAVAYGR
jgi:hypothetical protein